MEKLLPKAFLLVAQKKDALLEAATELDPSGEMVAIVAGDIGTAWQRLYREDASERILEQLMELGPKGGHCQ